MQCLYYTHFNLLDSVSKIVSKLTCLVLSSANLSGLLCIQDLDGAQKMGWFWFCQNRLAGRIQFTPGITSDA